MRKQYPDWIGKYPIFDEGYRPELNSKIENHFFFREIGYETPEMFIHQFNSWMNINMGKYNAAYSQNLSMLDPFANYTLRTTGKRVDIGDVKRLANIAINDEVRVKDIEKILEVGKTSVVDRNVTDFSQTVDTLSDSKSRSVSSDFPQTMLSSGGDYATDGADTIASAKGATGTSADTVVKHDVDTGRNDQTDRTRDGSTTDKSERVDDTSVKESGTSDSESYTVGRNTDLGPILRRFYDNVETTDRELLKALDPMFISILASSEVYSDNNFVFPLRPGHFRFGRMI